MHDSLFPPGTTIRVRQRVEKRSDSYTAEVVGEVEGWEDQPTGSWFAHAPGGRLRLKRLRLRKEDGELALLVVDDSTEMAKVDKPGK